MTGPARDFAPAALLAQKGPDVRLGELLIEAGLINEAQLQAALGRQESEGGKTAENLIRLGYLKPSAYMSFLARFPGVASITLSNYSVPRGMDKMLPREFLLQREVFPLDKMGHRLTLAMACPLDKRTIQDVEQRTGMKVNALLCEPFEIKHAIERYCPKEEASPL